MDETRTNAISTSNLMIIVRTTKRTTEYFIIFDSMKKIYF